MCFCITFLTVRERQRIENDLSEMLQLLALNQSILASPETRLAVAQ